ncbi:methyl-accepting chemotaxis protein [Rhizobium indigoferae]|uniref:Methyl-accepting chemotaxis protein n=1 Tax=Rhizobium indigoferae TaxID=158891 RepID=A0ABZ0ZEY0_9HYPH|nr:methyl-accepting chemotaxis protein [Rhizobium indigoferae]NNU56220.1 HAMP domain-containing protein [Rhizobium indigoferae]WQN37661.1 methyl-accepting chemotaxis protein [Rhizobium indigoferae]
MPQLTISRLLFLFALLVTAGLVVALCVQTYAMKRGQIEGPLYQEIAIQRDLLADLLPPPLFEVEAYAAVYEANFHPDRRARAIARIYELKKLYDERKSVWTSASIPPSEAAILNEKLIPASDRFWFVTLEQFVPAVGKRYDTMMAIMDDLARAYQDQRQAVLELSGLVSRISASNERTAVDEANWLGTSALYGGLLAVLIFVAGVIFIRIRAIAPLSSITAYMERLAAGESQVAVPFKSRVDEIGMIAKALEVFRLAGIQKANLEIEVEAASVERMREQQAREADAMRRANDTAAAVGRLGAALEGLANSNLEVQISEAFSPEFDQIRHDFNRSVETLQVTLERVMEGTSDVRRASGELSSGAAQMSRRTEQQAAALEEASAALEQITATIGQLTKSTEATRQLVGQARARAEASTEVTRNAVEAMNRIERSANEIAQIISVIDEIAFQTNLLALNAGVEAARAGESGKGFAVVASEVRELAQRSASAAKQIKLLIDNSTLEVSQGVKHVGETGKALTEISSFVASIDIKVDDIVVGIKEQSTGLRETSAAIHSLDSTTQQNAAMAEETAAMSNALRDQATVLSEEVEKFQLPKRNTVSVHGRATDTRFHAA